MPRPTVPDPSRSGDTVPPITTPRQVDARIAEVGKLTERLARWRRTAALERRPMFQSERSQLKITVQAVRELQMRLEISHGAVREGDHQMSRVLRDAIGICREYGQLWGECIRLHLDMMRVNADRIADPSEIRFRRDIYGSNTAHDFIEMENPWEGEPPPDQGGQHQGGDDQQVEEQVLPPPEEIAGGDHQPPQEDPPVEETQEEAPAPPEQVQAPAPDERAHVDQPASSDEGDEAPEDPRQAEPDQQEAQETHRAQDLLQRQAQEAQRRYEEAQAEANRQLEEARQALVEQQRQLELQLAERAREARRLRQEAQVQNEQQARLTGERNRARDAQVRGAAAQPHDDAPRDREMRRFAEELAAQRRRSDEQARRAEEQARRMQETLDLLVRRSSGQPTPPGAERLPASASVRQPDRQQTTSMTAASSVMDTPELSHEADFYLTLPKPWNKMPNAAESIAQVLSHTNSHFIKKRAEFDMTVAKYPEWRSSFLMLVHAKAIPVSNKLSMLMTTINPDEGFKVLCTTIERMDAPEAYRLLIKHLENHFGGAGRQLTPRQEAVRTARFVEEGDQVALGKFNTALHNLISVYKDAGEAPGMGEFNIAFERLSDALRLQYCTARPSPEDESETIRKVEVLHEWTQALYDRWVKMGTRGPHRNTGAITKPAPRPTTGTRTRASTFKSAIVEICPQEESDDDSLASEVEDYHSQKLACGLFRTSKGGVAEVPTCCFCPQGKNDHLIVRCDVFKKTPDARRIDLLCKDNRCLKCFRRGHLAKNCTSKVSCRTCKGDHNTQLHEAFALRGNNRKKAQQKAYRQEALDFSDAEEDDADDAADEAEPSGQAKMYRAAPEDAELHAMLPVVPITLKNGDKTVRVNALLDTGASSTLISKKLCDELGLKGESYKTRVALACDIVTELEKTPVTCTIVLPGGREQKISACAVENAVGHLEAIDWNKVKSSYPHLGQIRFPKFVPGEVQMLLGATEHHLMMPLELPISAGENEPSAFLTRLGWVAIGTVDDAIKRQHNVKAVYQVYARASLNRISDSELEEKQEIVARIGELKELEQRLRSGAGLSPEEYRSLYTLRKKTCPLDEQEEREKKAKVTTHILSPEAYDRLEMSLQPKKNAQQLNFSKAFEDELAKKILSEWEPDVSPQEESPSLSAEQERCWQLLREKRTFKDGHYFMPVLWRLGEPTLEPDYQHAKQRLDHLLRHLVKHNLTKEYDDQIREHINAGYLVKAEDHSGKFYLPHFAVIRDDKTTTQLRQVFDGAAARKGGRSLNSAISAGPKLITDLVQVLMYYRAHRVVLAGDIRHMFLQVFMYPEDRLYHHILHRRDERAPIEELQWTRHPFGSAGSPAVAIATLKLHASDFKEEFPIAARDVLQHSLVDDILSSYPTEEDAIKARQEWSELCEKAGMLVRKFITNSPEVADAIPLELREKRASLLDIQDLEGEHMVKTLGMRYSARADEFSYAMDLSDGQHGGWTKRKILICYSRFFDPLGLLAPFTIIPRHAFQALWQQEIGWDDELGPIKEWEDWLESARKDIGQLRIPRCVTRTLEQGACGIADQSLHVFADASGYALGVAIYLVTVYEDGLVTSNNVRSRAKLAQLKPTTIPRLELAAALLAVETAQSVITTYGIEKVTYYTDSTTTLLWLRTRHRQLKQYVANRVMKILMRSNLTDWLYVGTHENPADLPSRGALVAELQEQPLWWRGPDFLREQRQPEQPHLIVKEEQRDEFHKETKDLFEETPTEIACRHSIVPCDAHATASSLDSLYCDDENLLYLADAIDAFRDKAVGDNLSKKQQDEQILLRLIKGAQQRVWPELFDGCKPSHPLARVAPRVDHVGVLRITTRIALSKDTDVNPTPILLPAKEVISRLIVKDFHETELSHVGGPAYLLSRIRKDYWIHRGTRLVQTVLKKCLECGFKQAKPTLAPEAPLPSFRLPTKESFTAFTEVGTDCAGPWEVNVKRSTEKRWIVIFICMITRAIHTEVIDSLSTEKFLMALDMLAARRGMPKKIYSDNGTNFKGASKILNELLANNASSLDEHAPSVEWHFNTPFSPHQGGFWERSIGTLKSAMRKVLTCDQYMRHKLRAEEFRTLVTVAEGYVNHRPLTAVSMEGGDLAPISPADFCMSGDAAGFSLHPPAAQGGRTGKSARNTTHQLRWVLLLEYQEMLWKRLRHEVVPKYAEYRRTWLRNKANLRKGDIVVVMEPNSKGVHRLGRVLEVFTGVDGIARNASVKVLKTAEEIEEELASKRKKMTAEILVGHKIYQRSLASLAVLASTEEIDRVRRADLPPVPDLE